MPASSSARGISEFSRNSHDGILERIPYRSHLISRAFADVVDICVKREPFGRQHEQVERRAAMEAHLSIRVWMRTETLKKLKCSGSLVSRIRIEDQIAHPSNHLSHSATDAGR